MKKTHVEIFLKKDGSSEWVVQDLQHPGDAKIKHLTPTKDKAETHTTRISGNKARFFDAKGTLLFEKELDMSPFNQILEAIVSKGENTDLTSFGVVQGTPSQTIQTREVDLVKYFSTDSYSGNGHEVLIDANTNKVVETVLRNTQNEVITRVGFDYHPLTDIDAPGALRRVMQISYSQSQSGAPIISEMITALTNLTIGN